MTNYSTGTFASLTFQDYKEVLDPTNQIVELDQDKLLTNCICPHHKDNNPSLLLYKGNKVACVYHCYVCDRADVDSATPTLTPTHVPGDAVKPGIQVPVILNIKGPLSLRGKQEPYKVTIG